MQTTKFFIFQGKKGRLKKKFKTTCRGRLSVFAACQKKCLPINVNGT
jgi:hypothetical protein